MARYHVSPDGVARPCSASSGENSRGCKYGYSETEHYETKEDAQLAYENSMKSNYDMWSNDVLKDKMEAKKSADYQEIYRHLSIDNNHSHASLRYGETYFEKTYYSTAQGQKELDRRINNYDEEDVNKNPYMRIKLAIENGDFVKPAMVKEQLDMGVLNKKILLGSKNISRKFGENDASLINHANLEKTPEFLDNDNNFKHYIVSESLNFMKNLTVDEQDAIGEITSNGGENLKRAINEGDDSFSFMTFSREPYEHLRLVKQAFNKAPQVEPFITYRGTSVKEMSNMVGIPLNDDENEYEPEFFIKRIKNSIKDDQPLVKDSRISKIPESFTMDTTTARGFSEGIIIELKMTTSASPANVSSYGANEKEFLSNPNSNYTIKEIRAHKDSYGDNMYIVSIEEKAQ